MFDVALRVSIILGAAWLATAVLRRASAATRHLIWHGAFIAVLVAPIIAPVTPKFAAPGSALATAVAQAVTTIAHAPSPAPASPRHDASHEGPGALDGVRADTRRDGATPIAIDTLVWSAGSLILALWFAAGWFASARMVRRAAPADPAWQVEVTDLCRRLRIDADVRLRILSGRRSPIAVGLRSPAVLLPETAGRWSADRRRSVLLHELAHVKRRDCGVQALAQAACVLYWFNPLVWLAASRLASERERACDDFVLRCGAQPSAYATDLLEIARDLQPALRPSAALAMARPSELEGRLLAVLAAGRARVPAAQSRWLVAAFLLVLTATAVGAAPAATTAPALAPTPLGPTVRNAPSPEMPAAERRAADAVRERAVETLGSSSDPGARERAVLDLAAANRQESIAPLVAALDDRSRDVREKAALGLALMSGPEVVPALLKALTDRDAQVREKAAIGLALRGDEHVTDALIAAAHDPDSQVREKVAIALGTSGDVRAAATLGELLKDPDDQVREKAAGGLTMLNHPAAGTIAGERIREGVRSAIGLLLNLTR